MQQDITGQKLICDLIFVTQRASGETCEIASRTIKHNVNRFLEKYPGEVKNSKAFLVTSEKLCNCLLKLRGIKVCGPQEIIIKRQALDYLLALSNEIEYESQAPHASASLSQSLSTRFPFKRSA